MTAPLAQRLLEEDLKSVAFLSGVKDAYWELLQPVTAERWPHVFTHIRAAERVNAPQRYLVRWEVDDYNATRPSGAFWDEKQNTYLNPSKWPKGRAGSIVDKVFRIEGWSDPGQGFYHPWDRKAAKGHHQWPINNPDFVWTSKNTLTDFISLVHRLLNSDDYHGC